MEQGDTLLHPAVAGGTLYVVPTLVFAFVPPSSLGLRLLALGLMVCLQVHVISTARFYMRPSWSAVAAGHASFLVLHYIDVGLLRRYECANLTSGTDGKRDDRSLLDRLYRGWLLVGSIRKIDTPLETKNVPRFPQDKPPDRRAFLATQARQLVFCFLVIDLIFSAGVLSSPSASSLLTPPPDAPPLVRFAHLLPIVLGQGLTTYCLVQGMYSMGAFTAVALGLSEPRAWRPIIGSFGDLFTLRGTWGSFWHQLGRDLWSRPASAIVHGLLGFPRGNMWLAMHLKMAIVFALSGAVHLGCDMALGMSWSDSRSMHFFMLQAVGIMLESYASLLLGRDVVELPRHWSALQKMLGFVWVFFWMFWTASMWVVPMIEVVQRRYGLGDSMLPFSVLQPAAKLLLQRSF